MAAKKALNGFVEDDFVLTISDDDLDVPDFDEVDEEPAALEVQHGTKRKRGAEPANVKDDKTAKKQKGAKSAKKKKGGAMKEPTPVSEDEDDEDDTTAQGQNDGAIDPDFEFANGAFDGEVTAGFEGWEMAGAGKGSTGIQAPAIGIDEIIARRRQKEHEGKVDDGDDNGAVEGSDSEEDGADGVVSEEEEVEDDELLAEDGFGMGADMEDEEEDEDADAESGDEEDISEEANGVDGDSDDDSVAAPVAHPDDDLGYDNLSDGGDEPINAAEAAKQAAFYAPEEPAEALDASATVSFQSMSLSRPILKGLAAVGFTSPTPIQTKAIPVGLLGKDLVGGAVTGSGKTAAFVIPILERLLYRPKKIPTTRVAILMPTRELAAQCFSVATKLASFTDITFALIVGGLSLREQEQTLKKRPDVVIATPGRFIDHMRNSPSFVIENLEILVLDEADRMLEDGFADELNEILTSIPRSRQTMLFSATMTENVDNLVRVGLNRPVRLMVDAKKQTVQGLVQEFIKMKGAKEEIDEERRLAYLLHLCSTTYTAKTIVFFPKKTQAHSVKVLFSLKGIKAAELHGSMSQEQRLNAITLFRDGKCTHLLATDLASRGLDIPRVETVINFTVPTTTTTYLHRVGRTARAGRVGVACTLFSSAKGKASTKQKGGGGSANSERTLMRPILRIAKGQSADIRTRTLPPSVVNDLTDHIRSLAPEIEAILAEEKEERLLQQTERDVAKGENLVRYEEEIASRPKRTWFQGEKDKVVASERGKAERLGLQKPDAAAAAKGARKKLSGKDKKKREDREERVEGKVWKKGQAERAGKGVLEKFPQKKPKGAGKPKGGKPMKGGKGGGGKSKGRR